MRSSLTTLLLPLATLALAACGGSTSSNGPDGAPGSIDGAVPPTDGPVLTERYEPRVVGSVWTYKMTDTTTNTSAVKQSKVEAFEEVGGAHSGTFAYRVRIEKLNGTTVAYESYEGDLGVRYAQTDLDLSGATVDTQSENPYRLKIDETPSHLANNATYSENFDETTTNVNGTKTNAKTETWQVVSTAESVTVPAGTYTALHLHRTNPTNAKSKDFWFVKGVGKVKEIGGGQDEELMAYTP